MQGRKWEKKIFVSLDKPDKTWVSFKTHFHFTPSHLLELLTPRLKPLLLPGCCTWRCDLSFSLPSWPLPVPMWSVIGMWLNKNGNHSSKNMERRMLIKRRNDFEWKSSWKTSTRLPSITWELPMDSKRTIWPWTSLVTCCIMNSLRWWTDSRWILLDLWMDQLSWPRWTLNFPRILTGDNMATFPKWRIKDSVDPAGHSVP